MIAGTTNQELETKRPERFMFLNYYRCPYDGAAWVDVWSCACNDRCPICRAEIEPRRTEDIDAEE
jgi:hypothetical protein